MNISTENEHKYRIKYNKIQDHLSNKTTILQKKIFSFSLSGCDERRELKNAITENKCQRKT